MYSWSSYHAWAARVVTEELDFHFGTHFNRLKQPQCLSNTEAAMVHHVEVRRLVYFFCITRAVLSQNKPENDLWTVISTSNLFQWMGFQWRIYTSEGQSFSAVLFFTFVLLRSLSLAPNHLYWSLSKTDSMLEDRARSRSVAAATRSVWTNTHVSWSSSATQRSCTAHARHTVRLLDVILIFIMTFREYDCGVQLWRDNVNCVHRKPVNTDNVVYHLYSTTLLRLTVLSSNFLSSVLFSSSKRPAGCHRKTAVSTFVFVFII